MEIRRARPEDLAGIDELLSQVLAVHHEGRPDLFKPDARKYTDEELLEILQDESRPVFVADDGGQVAGYAFCMFQQYRGHNIMTDIRTLYIDDLCVDQRRRKQHIGRQLYDYVVDFARRSGCYNVTLNVWACNESARRFYESCGLVPQKIGMERLL
ncbi:MAG: GNAT family N-acetyltransferase [Eubacteriales bacterium]|nr:GNAT family N-acetyltransferase [Eubacteriales bacterium]